MRTRSTLTSAWCRASGTAAVCAVWLTGALATSTMRPGRRQRGQEGISLVGVLVFVVLASIVGTWWGWDHVARTGTAVANFVKNLGGPKGAK
jgi:hypothetical protein